MAIIPDKTNTTEHIIEHSHKVIGKPRPYLGMSGLGGECLRRQWYGWRWAKIGEITVRMQRLFNRGHLEEASIITDLVEAGMEVFRVTKKGKEVPMTGAVGEKQETIEGFHKHCFGHPDGRVRGVIEAPKTVHLLEMKTMNDKNYSNLLEKLHEAKKKYQRDIEVHSAALKNSFGGYYGQVTRYMGGTGLKRALFVVTNKNDQSRKYLRVKFNPSYYKILVAHEEDIIISEEPPPRKWKATHYMCAWCGFHQICHLDAPVAMNCRTCKGADICPEGKWRCSIRDINLSTSMQRRGCDSYTRLF